MRLRSLVYWLPLAVVVVLVALAVRWLLVRDTDPFVPKTDNTLRRWLDTDLEYLNPVLRTSVNAAWVLEYLHHYLLDWDMEHNVNKPKLAKSWAISEDGLDYTFFLRTDVKWHDGVPFDADDVMYSFKTVMDPDLPAGHARSDYMDTWIKQALPPDDGDGVVNATEYLALRVDALAELGAEPVVDGSPEAAAPVVAEASGLVLCAARHGTELYFCATRVPRHDLVVFVARRPGELVDYAPATKVAAWDAFFLADDGNTFPARTGWLAGNKQRVAGAAYALATDVAEARIDLRRLFGLTAEEPLPETVHLAVCSVDDVQLEKLDRYTVRFHFPRKIYGNLDSAGYLRLVAKHYYDDGRPFLTHPKRDVPLGVGPYKFVKWDRNNVVVLERWDDYWGEEKPKIKRIEFKIINDLVVAYQVFRKGDIDAFGSVGVWTYTEKSKGPAFDRHFYKLAYDRPGYTYMGYNTRISFFADKRCRQALSHLIDTRAAAVNLLNGLYPLVSGPFFYKEPAYDPTLPPYEYDIEKAKELLDEAGWTDHDGDGIRDKDINGDGAISEEPLDASRFQRERFVFEYLAEGGVDVANNWILLSYLRNCPKVGIASTARPVEYALKMEWLRQQTWDASVGGWVLSMESDPYMFFHSSQAKNGFNYGGYNNPEADRRMEAARQELDPDKRSALFRQVDRILWEDQPCSFLVGHNWRWVLNKRVKNVRQYDLGFDYLQWELEGHENGN